MSAIPRLTVSMPARDTQRFIGEAIASVLAQEGVDFELIVVDDGSRDGTAAVVEAIEDPRVRLIRNSVSRGISYCHNRVIAESRSPFIAHVDSDDVVLPGALAKLVAKLESDPKLGQVHCFDFDVDAEGRISREAFLERQRGLLELHRRGLDYKRQMMVLGMVANHLRTYRREALTGVGGFDESLRYGEDFEVSLRILDDYEIAVVPEMLYSHRLHGGNTAHRWRFDLLHFWFWRFQRLRVLERSGEVRFLKQEQYRLGEPLLAGLAHALRIPHNWYRFLRWRRRSGGSR